MTEYNVKKIRQQFPMLQRPMHGKPFIYLDSAATVHKPLSVIEAMSRFYSEQYATVHRAVYDFAARATDKHHAVRNRVKQFLNAAFPEEIIFTKGTTDGINLVANSFSKAFVNQGDEDLNLCHGAPLEYCPLANGLPRKRRPSQIHPHR